MLIHLDLPGDDSSLLLSLVRDGLLREHAYLIQALGKPEEAHHRAYIDRIVRLEQALLASIDFKAPHASPPASNT